ncbi:MAG: hydroxymethylglutaryl-CoA reductase, degradative [Spirochaetia bacterium]
MSSAHTGGRSSGAPLPLGFRKHDLSARRREVKTSFAIGEEEWEGLSASTKLLSIADVMVESVVGCVPIPLGIADGFLIDGEEVAIPMAVEEPSVIAAASFAAWLVRPDGGFTTWASPPLMTAQVFLEGVTVEGERKLAACGARVRSTLTPMLSSLERRGGGFRELRVSRLPGSGTVRADIVIDVRDAMGANRLNTAAERARPVLEAESGGRTLMAILTNAAQERLAGARFSIRAERLGIRLPAGMDGAEAVRRVARASALAQEDPSRAVTHNKGIMNGISSLALATMNDTRAVEAAAHAWAARGGQYRGLSTFTAQGDTLSGELELPLALATAGGSVDFHPAGRASLAVLGAPDAPRLSRIAAALGLAQNFAALLALVTTGIQQGHMRYHAARMAYRAGARGQEARQLAALLAAAETADIQAARSMLARLREGAG